MNDPHWLRVKTVLAAVLEEASDRRSVRLDELCGEDVSLRAEVESLLKADAGATTFLDRPLLEGIDVDLPEPHLGQTLGPYLLEECIGSGGMGTVYLARRVDQVFDRRVAVKMIRRGM